MVGKFSGSKYAGLPLRFLHGLADAGSKYPTKSLLPDSIKGMTLS